jgi:hypothetical protein
MTWDEMEAAVNKAEALDHWFIQLVILKPGYRFRGGGNMRTGFPGIGTVRVVREVRKDHFLIDVPVEKARNAVLLWRNRRGEPE